MFLNCWKILNEEVKVKRRFPVSFQFCCIVHLAVSNRPACQHSQWVTVFQADAACTLKRSCSSQGTGRKQSTLILCSALTNWSLAWWLPARSQNWQLQKQCSVENLKGKRRSTLPGMFWFFSKYVNIFICWIFYFASAEV